MPLKSKRLYLSSIFVCFHSQPILFRSESNAWNFFVCVLFFFSLAEDMSNEKPEVDEGPSTCASNISDVKETYGGLYSMFYLKRLLS